MNTRITAVVTGFNRLANSRNGNPRYKVHTTEGSFTTAADIAAVYEHSIDRLAKDSVPVYLTLNGRGQVVDFYPV